VRRLFRLRGAAALTLIGGLAAWNARFDFGSDGRTSVSGFVAAATPVSLTNGIDGSGTGSVSVSDTTGRACSGSTFSWSISPSP
jgi:hypothetical protein